MAKGTDKTLDALLACARPSDAARVLGMDGKALRNVLRSRFGVYVSHGAAFDERTKRALYAYVSASDIGARNAAVDAFKSPKPKRTRTPKVAPTTDAPAEDAPATV